LGCKFAVYAVDAIPGPGGWTRKRNVFRGKQKIVARTFSAADYVASSNPHMLEYQLTVFPHKEGLQTGVLLTPSPDRYYKAAPSDEMLFLYTGSLYGMRNPVHFFKAFKRLLVKYPEAKVLIVGMKHKLRNVNRILTPEELEHIILGGHTTDLEPLFSRAKVLVDIDADLEKDPFLSSKIVTYLKVNRVILSETGKITPSREMFAGLNTVVQCDHNEESLYEGMLRAIEVADSNPDFSERDALIEQFSSERVGAKLYEGLQQIVLTPRRDS
jgi:glycosyltransferase involved in cell wall biosynthesis